MIGWRLYYTIMWRVMQEKEPPFGGLFLWASWAGRWPKAIYPADFSAAAAAVTPTQIIKPRSDKEAPPPQGGLGVGPDKPKKGQPLGQVGGPMRWREREPTNWPARWPLWMPRPEISSRAHFWEPQKKGGRRPPLPVGSAPVDGCRR
mgnify:CR=1 FL=1